jgi:hypothetical protein
VIKKAGSILVSTIIWYHALCNYSAMANANIGQAAPAPARPLGYSGAAVIPTDKPLELQQVEAALGRDMGRDFNRYLLMFQYNQYKQTTFASFLAGEYANKRRSGLIMAAIVSPALAGLTTMGCLSLYYAAKKDGGGYCNDPPDENGFDTCDEDAGELVGIILISSLGGITTLAVFIPGISKYAKYNKRLRRLKPLLPPEAPPPLSFTFNIDSKYIKVGFRF